MRKQLFVDEYLIDLNQTAAAIRAGYAPKSAKDTATRLMKEPAVVEAIEKAMAERSRRTGISQDRVINELAKIAFVNPADFIDFKTGGVKKTFSPDDTAAISSVKVMHSFGEQGETEMNDIGLHNKIKALELLGKHLGMFDSRLAGFDNEINININNSENNFDEC